MAVKFKKSSSDFTLITCDKETVYKSDNGTVDFVCELQFPVVAMSVSFTASTVVCSIYISGGRNVALKQPAEQSSLYTGLYRQGIYGLAPYAVDGNTNSSWNSSSCTHTSDDDLNPYWKVTFIKPYLVNRYVIFNRFDPLPANDSNPNVFKLGSRAQICKESLTPPSS
ncbi:fucolectin-5-like [Physella acuta]|uniref:fucolectin-5-like n=1 Tax=Physella acuta TaxID=109671 RepID=UPI0027DC6D3E|nr:fucolectin-5-like [Physella acuta]